MSEISRRGFLKDAGLVAGGIAGVAATGAALADEVAWMPETWDAETEILIIGYGFAGESAALAAAKAGAKALVIEAAPIEERGGNSTCCGACWVTVYNEELYARHLGELAFHVTPQNLLDDWAHADLGIADWFDELDVAHHPLTPNYSHFHFDPQPDDDPSILDEDGKVLVGIDMNECIDENGVGLRGLALHNLLADKVEAAGVEVLYENRAMELIQNPLTKEIIGCRAETPDGDKYFKATKGVLLCCGGFENSPELTDTHILPGARLYPAGSMWNRGDGIRMAAAVGAQLWHMAGIEWSGYGIKVFGDDQCTQNAFEKIEGGFIVNRHGERMYNENKKLRHTKEFPALNFKGFADDKEATNEFWGIPSWIIMDETERLEGSSQHVVAGGWIYWHGLYEWSEDFSKEVENGIMVKGDTIEELAEKCGLPVDALSATLKEYNELAANGDTKYRRKYIRALEPPYYALVAWPTVFNTQGGPKHSNLNCRCVDYNDVVIPRLYSCGELGSVYSMLYHGSGNVAEAIMTGKLAAEDAAALTGWE